MLKGTKVQLVRTWNLEYEGLTEPQNPGRKSTRSLPHGCTTHDADEDGDGLVDDDTEDDVVVVLVFPCAAGSCVAASDAGHL